VVRVRPLEEPERLLRIDPLTRGSLVHRVLQRFMEETPRPLSPTTAGAHQAALLRIAQEELATAEARGLTGTSLLWGADRREILDDLATWLDQEIADASGLPSCDVEVSFGRDPTHGGTSPLATTSPLVFSAGGRAVRLGGTIDRLDHGSGGAFRVIDYKTGSGSGLPRDGNLKGGQALQLPLYLLAGAMILGADPASGVAAYHLVSRRGRFKRIAFSGEDLAARRGDLDQVLDRIAGGIADGDFHPEPSENTCRYCDYRDLCDVGRVRIAARKAGDPSRASFAAMREIE
jgi:RecB family exonuclease